jgi:hypothetical protein
MEKRLRRESAFPPYSLNNVMVGVVLCEKRFLRFADTAIIMTGVEEHEFVHEHDDRVGTCAEADMPEMRQGASVAFRQEA